MRQDVFRLFHTNQSISDFLRQELTSPDKSKKKSFTEDMEKRERAVCGTLCLCLAVAVMSAVALVYLTGMVHI